LLISSGHENKQDSLPNPVLESCRRADISNLRQLATGDHVSTRYWSGSERHL